MAEYIERDALEGAFDAATMAFLEKEDHLFDRKSVLAGMSVAAGIVHTVPAADVAPVVHGYPIAKKRPKNYEVCHFAGVREDGESIYTIEKKTIEDNPVQYCSVCGERLCSRFTNYCPNCGAKLDLPHT